MEQNLSKVFPKLKLTALLSASLTIALSLIYILLSILAIVFHFNCNVVGPEVPSGSEYFWHSLYAVYIQGDACTNDITLTGVELTSPMTVLILVIITILISVLSLASAIILITIVRNKDYVRHVALASYIHAGMYLAVLIVDITFGTHFGIDITALNTAGINIGAIHVDTLRMGAALLMVLSLKGFVAHIVNMTLVILLLVYLTTHQKLLQKNVHSIHKLGALNGYQSHMNNGFVHDEEPPRSPIRDDARVDRSYDRSDSWHHTQPTPGSRPFSYLEEARRPIAVKPPTTPDQPWRRDPWPAPIVPAPDYSPLGPRRLKSALKPGYM